MFDFSEIGADPEAVVRHRRTAVLDNYHRTQAVGGGNPRGVVTRLHRNVGYPTRALAFPMSLRTVGPVWNCGVLLAIRTSRGVPVNVADNAVDMPLFEVVIDAIDNDNDLSDEVKCYVLAALEGPTAPQALLDCISTPHIPKRSGEGTAEGPFGAFRTSVRMSGFRGIGARSVLGWHVFAGPAGLLIACKGFVGRGAVHQLRSLRTRATIRMWWLDLVSAGSTPIRSFNIPVWLEHPGCKNDCLEARWHDTNIAIGQRYSRNYRVHRSSFSRRRIGFAR